MSQNTEEKKPVKRVGRPKTNPIIDEVVDEKNQERLDMNKKESEKITIEDLGKRWNSAFQKMASLDGQSGIANVATKWNKLNPFLQNQRIKEIYTQSRTFGKAEVASFLQNPGSHEQELRGLGWANSSSQQIYYNMLRRSADIPKYNYYVIPELLEADEYNNKDFQFEDNLINNWLEMFNVANTFKTIALEVKREGKSSYLLRNKFAGEGKSKTPVFATLQKMPTDWVKITGKGQLGFTISFNMLYFLNIANSPSDFGDFMEKAWNDMIQTGVITEETLKDNRKTYKFDSAKAVGYHFEYNGVKYGSMLESKKLGGRQISYMF